MSFAAWLLVVLACVVGSLIVAEASRLLQRARIRRWERQGRAAFEQEERRLAADLAEADQVEAGVLDALRDALASAVAAIDAESDRELDAIPSADLARALVAQLRRGLLRDALLARLGPDAYERMMRALDAQRAKRIAP